LEGSLLYPGTSYSLMRWCWCLLCTGQTCCVGYLQC
jgi:hypothetical protein